MEELCSLESVSHHNYFTHSYIRDLGKEGLRFCKLAGIQHAEFSKSGKQLFTRVLQNSYQIFFGKFHEK